MYRNKKSLVAIAVITISSMMISSCTVNMDTLKDGVIDLKDAVSSELSTEAQPTTETVQVAETTVAETEPATTDAVVDVAPPTETPEPTETPTPTPRPTNTPTPLPERVDFSELTEVDLDGIMTIESEEFAESYVTDSDITVATFTGTRVLVSSEDDSRVCSAINLILDGFYQEAVGLYNRYTNEGLAAIELAGEEEEVFGTAVNVSYVYSNNSRVLSVIMKYEVVTAAGTDMEEVAESAYEYVSFDMLTGQYVTLASVASDYIGLTDALAEALADYTEDNDNASDFSNIAIAAQVPGAETATAEIYGTKGDEVVHVTVNMYDYAEYLNRYGMIAYGVN